MPNPAPRSNELGILYSKNGDGSGTYVDVAGVTQQNGTLTGSFTEQTTVPLGHVDYSHPWVGAMQALSLFVDIGEVGTVTYTVKLQGRTDSSAAWADIQSARQDTGVVAAEHAFTSAGTYLLQTSSALSVPQIRIVGKGVSGGALVAGDFLVVRGWME
jgi:hypothetical protein